MTTQLTAYRNDLKHWFPHLEDGAHPDWGAIPHYMREGLVNYILNGIPPGGFLCAFINNDLMRALGKADSSNINRLKDYGTFFYNHSPQGCYGYGEAVNDWVEKFDAMKKEAA